MAIGPHHSCDMLSSQSSCVPPLPRSIPIRLHELGGRGISHRGALGHSACRAASAIRKTAISKSKSVTPHRCFQCRLQLPTPLLVGLPCLLISDPLQIQGASAPRIWRRIAFARERIGSRPCRRVRSSLRVRKRIGRRRASIPERFTCERPFLPLKRRCSAAPVHACLKRGVASALRCLPNLHLSEG